MWIFEYHIIKIVRSSNIPFIPDAVSKDLIKERKKGEQKKRNIVSKEKLVNIFEINEHINWQNNWNKIEKQREGKLLI